ncbi:MAG: hypothetical protein AB1704_16125 [Pseudomonadota bacterium]|uniref:c-type cytochrome n=1 Tax=Paraburkholderia TaxID=1822464 RepID=UPI0000332AB4|nr:MULTISPECIES: hypothetical protein [Paraburkholderia]PNE56652.1 hypothetical protein A8H39_12830 [Paraburkholderia fungorum]USU14485.1 hypothetical protein NFE55_12645 [Paraburkholderia fungorum]USU22433.1 hypothetical protein NFS19_12645 [Paraburkholderia fungorum]
MRPPRSRSPRGGSSRSNPPSFAWKLSDTQVAAVVTYVLNSWGNAAPAATTNEVTKARKALSARPQLIIVRPHS